MSSLSETAIYSLRHKNKASISKYFYQYVNSKLFLNTVEKLKLNRYSFIIAEERHCSQILDLICYQFSRLGRSPDRILFDWSISDITTLYEIKIKHAIKCGSMILILDENHQIAAVNGLYDLCDTPNINHIKSELPLNVKHWLQIASKVESKYMKENEVYYKIINKGFSNIDEFKQLYGKYCCFTPGVVRPDCMNKGLMFITLNILIYLSFNMNYRYLFGNVTNPSQVRKFKVMNPTKIWYIDYGYGYLFDDGINVKQYFDKLKKNYDYNDTELKHLNEKLKMYMFIVDFNELRQKMVKLNVNMEQLSQMFMQSVVYSFEKYNKRKSKL
eukprot:385267_1